MILHIYTIVHIAPMQTEPPFQITQLVTLALFVLLTIIAAIRFRPEPVRLPS
jgi:hypothetical protein